MSADVNELYTQFEACESVHTQEGIESDTESAYRFYEGDQWYGLESGGEQLPVYNFIAPLIKYKTAMVAMNNMTINYSAEGESGRLQDICAELTSRAMKAWERLDMDSKCWETVKAAMISGDSYAYFYGDMPECQILDKTDVFFADEKGADINSQPYIFIRERKPVSQLYETAVANGVSKQEAQKIKADGDGDDSCTGLLKLWLSGEDLHFMRFTKDAVYQPEQVIRSLGCYPIAGFVCSKKRGSIRGMGEVGPLIANQIEINRNLARRLMNAKLTAYSRLVYSSERIANPSALTEVGTAIEVEGGGVGSIKDAVSYLTPSSMSPDAKTLSDEILSVTKELSGAGDAVLGSIDPTQASGTAIIAVRDQAALALNEQTAMFRRFVEQVARIWYRLWAVYGKAGELMAMEPVVRVDVCSGNPFSRYAREQAVERLFTMGHLSLEEYIYALEENSSVPKAKLEHIIKRRGGSENADNGIR